MDLICLNKKMLSDLGANDVRQGERMVLGGGGEEDSWEPYIEVPVHILDKIREKLDTVNENTRMEYALVRILASLVAAKSIIITADQMGCRPSKAVASDAIFSQMIKDYGKAIDLGRKILNGS